MSVRSRNSRAKKKKEEKKLMQVQQEQNRQNPKKGKLSKAEKKRRKKENKMAKNNTGKKSIGFLRQVGNVMQEAFSYDGYLYPGYKRLPEPTDGKEDNTLNLVLFSQKFLNGIADQCVPVAGGSEFQTHYRALQVIVSNDVGRIVFTIPTVFFNFPQRVSTGSVDYDLREVSKISAELKPKSDKIAAQIAQVFPVSFFQEMGFNVKMREDEVGSIHRHPGDFSFSSIDLDKNPEKPGVIYRQAHATDHIQTDSVLYIQAKNHVKLVTTQTRVVDVRPVEGGGFNGTYKRAKTIAMIYKDTEASTDITNATPQIVFDQFFIPDGATEKEGIPEVLKNYLNRFDGITESDAESFIDKAAMVFQILLANNYQAINKLDPNLIENNTWSGKSYYGGYNGYGNNHQSLRTRKYSSPQAYMNSAEDIDEPGDLKEDVVSEFLNIDKTLHHVSDITEEEMRTYFWNCCGNKNGLVGIALANGSITIEVITPKSNLMKVTLRTTLPSGIKNSITKYINKLNADEYYIDETELIEVDSITKEVHRTLDGIDEALDAAETEDNTNEILPDIIPLDPNLTAEEQEKLEDEITLKKLFLKCYKKPFSELALVNQFNDDALKEILIMLKDIDTSKLYFKTDNVEITCTSLNVTNQCHCSMKTKSSLFTRLVTLE